MRTGNGRVGDRIRAAAAARFALGPTRITKRILGSRSRFSACAFKLVSPCRYNTVDAQYKEDRERLRGERGNEEQDLPGVVPISSVLKRNLFRVDLKRLVKHILLPYKAKSCLVCI
ncbi:unnamed protein product [Cylicocyclus nassatus]|uniref:Uncharacterized protein n=1 Tax=Cylicocyclus nassatus TaxID=53992 RepID=A0AA36GS12_CYLNA|nr:unnamed protein product [Cylicocyclus nassatus]